MDEAQQLHSFFDKVQSPMVVVGTLMPRDREAVVLFLLKLNAPSYLEAGSGLREDARLSHLRVTYIQNLWENANHAGYPIDGILRIGGVPTFRPWRDLESMVGQIEVCSVSHLPFSGLSWGQHLQVDLSDFFLSFDSQKSYEEAEGTKWHQQDRTCHQSLCELLLEEPRAEPGLLHCLSRYIPEGSMVYLGNSLPIREWDLAATYESRGFEIYANRGLNGIDGQISSFLGLCQPHRDNWAILGDLTVLYDMAGPWILNQLADVSVNIVVVNNGGGKIFSRMFSEKEFQNSHHLDFRGLADLWKLRYEKWSHIPRAMESVKSQLIELVPDMESTERFWDKYQSIPQHAMASI